MAASISFNVRVVAYEPCPRHPFGCEAPTRHPPGADVRVLRPDLPICADKRVVRLADGRLAVHEDPTDLGTTVLLGIFSCNIVATGQTVKNTSGTGISVSANSTVSSPVVVAGTGTTAAAVGDTNLQAQSSGSSGSQAITSVTVSGATIVIVGTITNGSSGTIAYDEVGLEVTIGANTYLLAHDAPLNGTTGYNVSIGGTLGITYTGTVS